MRERGDTDLFIFFNSFTFPRLLKLQPALVSGSEVTWRLIEAGDETTPPASTRVHPPKPQQEKSWKSFSNSNKTTLLFNWS